MNGGGCRHSDYAKYLDARVAPKVVVLAAIYRFKFGRSLSLNDASLPLGGVIANKTFGGSAGGRDADCHKSHRIGIDIDLNQTDIGGVNMMTTPVDQSDPEYKVLDYIEEQVANMGGNINASTWKEQTLSSGESVMVRKTIHWRFPAN